MRRVVEAYPERVLIGEIYLPLERLVAYYGEKLAGVHLPFNFQLLFTPWQASSVAALIEEYERALPAGAWPNWVLGNHDQKRVATRIGSRQARIAAMLLLTLRGTPTLYYGDEIGMIDVPIPPEAVQDPWGRREPGLGLGRDPQRTPMQWNGSLVAGFTDGTPWLPVAAGYLQANVAIEKQDPASILTLYRNLIALRRSSLALTRGSYRRRAARSRMFWPTSACEGDERLLVVLNFDSEPKELTLPPWSGTAFCSRPTMSLRLISSSFVLRPDEGVIIGNATNRTGALHDQ